MTSIVCRQARGAIFQTYGCFTADRWSPDKADDYIAELTAMFDTILEFPALARERTEFKPPVRVRRYQSHLIVYRLDDDHIHIIRVLHGHRDWQAIIGDEGG